MKNNCSDCFVWIVSLNFIISTYFDCFSLKTVLGEISSVIAIAADDFPKLNWIVFQRFWKKGPKTAEKID